MDILILFFLNKLNIIKFKLVNLFDENITLSRFKSVSI